MSQLVDCVIRSSSAATSWDSRSAPTAGSSPWRNSRAGIEILDLEKPHEPRRALRGASDRVGAVAFSPDGRTLAMAGDGGGAGLLDVQRGRILDLFDDRVNYVAVLAGLRGGRTHAGDGRR